MQPEEYLKSISDSVIKEYDFIKSVKSVNIPLAKDVAARVEGLLSVLRPDIIESGLSLFIRDSEKKYGANDWRVGLDSAKAVAREKFVKFENPADAIEMGIRAGLAYLTLGAVSAPLEGFVRLELKKRRDGQQYISCFFGGPIRGAGGTAAAAVIVLADALRVEFNLGKYDPDESEIGRIKVEITDYNDYEARLQYLPHPAEVDFLLRNLPVEIDGDPTTDREVSAYKNLPRIKTNRIRGGVCLVLCEGFSQKAAKVHKTIKSFSSLYGIDVDFSFIPKYLELKEIEHAKSSTQKADGAKVLPNYRYLEEIAAGRPVFSYPLRSGGFRLRYGRARTSGLAAAAINPITNIILSDFIATGSQLRVELPGKACAVTPCDSIDGPTVKLRDGTVVRPRSKDHAKRILSDIKEIIYIGDILFNYGDFSEQGHLLMPSPFVDEWWERIVEKMGEKQVNESRSLKYFDEYAEFCAGNSIPLHPKYIYFWTQITYEQLYSLVENVYAKGRVDIQEKLAGHPYKVLELPYNDDVKRTLELLGIEHSCPSDIIVEDADAFLFTIGSGKSSFDNTVSKFDKSKSNIEILSEICGIKIMDKAGTFIGGRLGRPEKAKMREMDTNPNIIFPIGESGGNSRSITAAAESATGNAYSEYGKFYCKRCSRDTIYNVCENCGSDTDQQFVCKVCGAFTKEKMHHGKDVSAKIKMNINLKSYLEQAYARLKVTKAPGNIKGVKGVFNSSGRIERLEKGVLRSLYGLNVNKDGTVRFDAIEVPITHFKPKEVAVNLDALKGLGYTEDIYGKALVSEEQVLQLMPQDIILPTYGDVDENGAEVFVRVSNFVDDLLEKLHGAKRINGVSKKEDLVGKFVVGLAPHTSAGVVGRIIGFSKTQGLFAHPFFHAAMRRNCDGDEASLLLLSDMLLNFDRQLLPDTRGARYMDSPLVLSINLDVTGIDAEAYNLDIVDKYPLEFYEATKNYPKPSDVKIKQVKDIMKDPMQTIYFTHDTSDINGGVNVSSYKTLKTMHEKVDSEMSLGEKIRAIDIADVARIIIEKHFIKDIKGNLRRFGTQEFRCVKCNQRYQRPPLIGRCNKCGGNLVLTSSEGNIKKYLSMSIEIADKYNITRYVHDELNLLKMNLDAIFGEHIEKQQSLLTF